MIFKKTLLFYVFLLIIIFGIFSFGVYVGTYRIPPFNKIYQTKQFLLKITNDLFSVKVQKPAKDSSFSKPIRFISFGDVPYMRENDYKIYSQELFEAINSQNPSLIIHTGDLFADKNQCTNSIYNIHLKLINTLNAPVLYTPGDNEWVDCVNEAKSDNYSIDRLSYLRKLFFLKKKTLGKNKIDIENQGARNYPENARLMIEDVAFITTHNVSSHNNFDPQSKENTLEYFDRNAANIDWIIESFKKYKKANAFVIAYHANIFKRKSLPVKREFKNFSETIKKLSNKYKKPVLILFGDSHKFQAFKPEPNKFPFLYAIQNFGDIDFKAIEIEVNSFKDMPFNISKIISDTKIITEDKLIKDQMHDILSDYPIHCNLCKDN